VLDHLLSAPQRRPNKQRSDGNTILAPLAEVPLPLAIGSLLTILWKYTLMHWYKVDIEKKQFIKDTVWSQAIRRFAELCLVQLAKYRKAEARAQARGAHEPTTKYNK
jgi:hypothetical protein